MCNSGCNPYNPYCGTPYCYPSPTPTCSGCPRMCPIDPCAVDIIILSSTATDIPSGPVNTAPVPIPPGSTSIPVGSFVTVIRNFNSTPLYNNGGISYNNVNGQFTIPVYGNYLISANVSFGAFNLGTRETYLYKIDGSTGIISLIVSDSRNATVNGSTDVVITTNEKLNVGDRVFLAVTQNSGLTLPTLAHNRMSITKL